MSLRFSHTLPMTAVNRAGSVSEISPRHSFLRKILDRITMTTKDGNVN